MIVICEMCGSEIDSDCKYCYICEEFVEPEEIEEEDEIWTFKDKGYI